MLRMFITKGTGAHPARVHVAPGELHGVVSEVRLRLAVGQGDAHEDLAALIDLELARVEARAAVHWAVAQHRAPPREGDRVRRHGAAVAALLKHLRRSREAKREQ
eukprot:1178370-Prorocentrum_minimum.AAC.7